MSDKPLHLLVVSMWPSAAAPERGIFVQRQVEALQRAGHLVEVAPLTSVKAGRLRTPLKYARLALRASSMAKQPSAVQLVHGHYLVPTGSVTRWIARRNGLPYVVTAHGTDVRNAESSESLRASTEPVVRDAAAVIAVSEALAERLRALYPGLEVHVGDMGVDTTIFTPRAGTTDGAHGKGTSTRQRVIAVGSLLANKNHERLLRAVATLDGARAVVIGEGEQRPLLEQLASELGLHDRVALPGRVAHEDLATWYRNIDAACLVSLDEGFGLAALEALACGTPVVVSRAAPVSALVQPGINGAVVDPTDVADIARGIAEAARLPHASPDQVAATIAGRSTDDRARELVTLLRTLI